MSWQRLVGPSVSGIQPQGCLLRSRISRWESHPTFISLWPRIDSFCLSVEATACLRTFDSLCELRLLLCCDERQMQFSLAEGLAWCQEHKVSLRACCDAGLLRFIHQNNASAVRCCLVRVLEQVQGSALAVCISLVFHQLLGCGSRPDCHRAVFCCGG